MPKRTVCGIGYNSGGEYPSRADNKPVRCYSIWKAMLRRCYVDTCKDYVRYGAKGVIVCDEWHDYQAFAAWADQHYVEGYHLDKDLKVKGNMVYGPSGCSFVPALDNIADANAMEFTLTAPDGSVVSGYNLKEFCRENNLDRANIRQVMRGQRKSCKGWKK
ncbi:HNH endonuclease [Vibrio phage vB_VspP_pVa5]|uniref:HNH homing endonuclease protein n=1 Tax=Vibrio phage vB_VspP_pVa5 TaxID=1913109 RepID=A0A1J0GV47_9CAUD|nr:HNH endonuclease [Vibrio phage vB_VspP_pVa5]APC46057.1 HNH homing endonuclease protein [Vibrio phage vB_VspP_pVa5]